MPLIAIWATRLFLQSVMFQLVVVLVVALGSHGVFSSPSD
jgi:hypothetical protein